jgi:hypothetical protein
MARTLLSVQPVVRTGLAVSYAAADGTDQNAVPNDGRTILHVKNGGGSSINVTIDTPGSVDGLAVGNLVVAVPAGAERFIGPFPTNIYSQADGNLYVDWSAVTSVTVAALTF